MKTYLIPFLMFIILLTGCKTQQSVSKSDYDDVYSPKGSVSSAPSSGTYITEDLSSPKKLTTDTSQVKLPGSSTLEGDYNDYTTRIKKFGHPDQNKGYYDDSYTQNNSYDTVTKPASDVNIYCGGGYDNWYDPGFSLSFGFGWGYPNYGWGYPYYGWYSPYYDWWYYPYYPYYYGDYWSGYYNGYWDGSNGYPYDPYYSSYSYYGKRTMGSTSGDLSSPEVNGRTVEPAGQNGSLKNDRTADATKNERTTVSPPVSGTRSTSSVTNENPTSTNSRSSRAYQVNPSSTTRTSLNQTPVEKEQYRYKRTTTLSTSSNQRSSNAYNERSKPAPKYTRPQSNMNENRTGNIQSYSSPAYRQPKSSQEYINPHPQSTRTSTSTHVESDQRSSGSQNHQQRESGYSREYNNQRHYSSPSQGQQKSYSTPSRSYSTPSNSSPSRSSAPRTSTPSYSAPSNSSTPSYSAPSRSGGSSGGSSGSSGGGGRRK
jgi:hypothetical protein